MDRLRFRIWDGRTFLSPSTGRLSGTVFFDDNMMIKAECSYTIEQCTGLKDKNGALIYEGDILVIPNQYPWFSEGYHNYISVIEWEYGAWYYSMDPINTRTRGSACGDMLCSGGNEDSQVFEIIGNIHETFELRKV